MFEFLTAAETASLLRAVAPACRDPDGWASHLSSAMHRFGISNDLNFAAAFVAQLMVESNELNALVESLNYSAERLCAVWPKRFPTMEAARRYARNPRALANYVYGGRMGNDPRTDDGWLFVGRGPIQTTGRSNYARLQGVMGIPLLSQPELLEEPAHGAFSAAWYWWEHKLSFLAADLPDDDDGVDFITITRKINGGTHGKAQRQAYWRKARAHLQLPIEATTA